MILFIALPEAEDKNDPGVTTFPLGMLPRRCPLCGKQTIIGHGRRRRQAHDQQRDWIGIRRGLCRLCRKTFTVLPTWAPPYGHYSLPYRQQVWESRREPSGSWERSVPNVQDPTRLPDPSTLRRWSRRLVRLGTVLGYRTWQATGWSFLALPTILAWDWLAISRILPLEANSS